MTKADLFKERINGKNITVIGIGISNLPLIRFLVEAGANVTACDAHDADWLGENYKVCCELGVKTVLGDGYLDNITDDIIFKTYKSIGLSIPQQRTFEMVKEFNLENLYQRVTERSKRFVKRENGREPYIMPIVDIID